MDTRKLEILKTDTYTMLSLAEPGQGGRVITRLELENIEAMREVRRRYNAHAALVEALEAICDLPADDQGERTIPAAFLDQARQALTNANA